MRTITRVFDTLKQAERFQERLYGEYDRVRLIRAPRFTETGPYAWEVGHDAERKGAADGAPVG